jgi:hypothetical protein
VLWALEFFCEEILQDHVVKGLVGHELLELAVLVFDQPQPLGVTDFQAAELLLPLVVGGLADAVTTAEFVDGGAGLGLVEDLNDLLFGVSLSFHGSRNVAAFAAGPQPSSGLIMGGSSSHKYVSAERAA